MSDTPPSIRARLNHMEKFLGKGPTYSRDDRQLILDGVLPEWLLRGAVMLEGPIGNRCRRAVEALIDLHSQVDERTMNMLKKR